MRFAGRGRNAFVPKPATGARCPRRAMHRGIAEVFGGASKWCNAALAIKVFTNWNFGALHNGFAQ